MNIPPEPIRNRLTQQEDLYIVRLLIPEDLLIVMIAESKTKPIRPIMAN